MKQLFCDCKTDDEKSTFFLSGRAVETGVIAPAISNDVAMAYHRCSELKKELEVERMRLAACGVAALGYFNGCAKEYESSSLYDVMELRAKNEELRAKIEEMEQQEPVATIHINSITGNPGVDFIPGHQYLNHNSSLYALPGAQPAPSVPDGWKLVPIEPTTIMWQYAGSVEVGDSDIGRFVLSWDEIESIYAAMIDAAPEAKP